MKMYVVTPNGEYKINPAEDPHYSDMVVYHTNDGGLKIEAPATGHFSTTEQCKTVNGLAGEWLESKVAPKGRGEVVIEESCARIAKNVDVSYIVVTIKGGNALSKDEATSGAGLIGKWVGKTAKNAIGQWVDNTAKAPTAPAKTATPPADTGKTTPPANTGKTTPPAKATKDTGVHWDNSLSVDENIERLWNSAG